MKTKEENFQCFLQKSLKLNFKLFSIFTTGDLQWNFLSSRDFAEMISRQLTSLNVVQMNSSRYLIKHRSHINKHQQLSDCLSLSLSKYF